MDDLGVPLFQETTQIIQFIPIPSQFIQFQVHYTFNLRDFSKVICGVPRRALKRHGATSDIPTERSAPVRPIPRSCCWKRTSATADLGTVLRGKKASAKKRRWSGKIQKIPVKSYLSVSNIVVNVKYVKWCLSLSLSLFLGGCYIILIHHSEHARTKLGEPTC